MTIAINNNQIKPAEVSQPVVTPSVAKLIGELSKLIHCSAVDDAKLKEAETVLAEKKAVKGLSPFEKNELRELSALINQFAPKAKL